MKEEILKNSQEAKLLEKRIESFLEGYRQNISIIGSDFTHKIAILENIIEKKFNENRLFPIYINLEYLSFSDFTLGIFNILLFNFLKQKKISPSYDIDSLLKKSQEFIPQTAQEIKTIVEDEKPKKYNLEHITKILDAFLRETNSKIILILDNFSKITNFSKKISQELAKYIITQQNIMFIFVDQDQEKAELLLSQELNLLFGNFEKIPIQNLSIKETNEYLNLRLGKQIPVLLKKFLIDISDGVPLYSEIISDHLTNCNDTRITSDTFADNLSSLLTDPKSPLYQIFCNKIKIMQTRFKDEYSINPLLTLLAQGYTRKKDLISILKIKSKNLTSRLNKLMDHHIINKTGTFYYISDKLFAFWISCIFKRQINLPLFFTSDKKEYTTLRVTQAMEEFKDTFTKDNFQRFVDLIHLFKDDKVKINNKSIPLPYIKRFRIIPASSQDMKFVIGEAKNYYLIVAFKENSPKDTDIMEFSNRCSYFRKRPPKKIFITLKKADLTAKVLAKEKKLFFWEREQVNLLFRLYNQPSLI